MVRIRRLLTIGLLSLLLTGLMAPAASAQSCLSRLVQFERELFGTAFGQDVALFARNPVELTGERNLGGFVGGFARLDREVCPF